MNNTYTCFSAFYDLFMDNIDYVQWGEYLLSLLKEYDIRSGLVLELGCGTGNMTEFLAAKGYDMIGLDSSCDMLDAAMEKKSISGHDILYLNQDMREFELYGTVAAVVSICDSLNYITKYEELVTVFKLVNNYLDPKGIFFFDFNTRYKYETVIGDSVIAENREDCSFIWENYFDPGDGINEYDLTVFVKKQELFERFQEVHFQRGYTLEEIKSLLGRAGLSFVRAYDADTLGEVTAQSERIYCVAQEKIKKKG